MFNLKLNELACNFFFFLLFCHIKHYVLKNAARIYFLTTNLDPVLKRAMTSVVNFAESLHSDTFNMKQMFPGY